MARFPAAALDPWAFANAPLLGAKKDLRRGVVGMTLARGKEEEKGVLGGAMAHFMGKKGLEAVFL